ncbi:hypothetical protein MUK42_20536 [Musa troglodytarum]|uniref:Uncharacterized protein n=3 Tax=Musa troglodytarum TaxID=320322 RepID=A0A9E7G1F2_9LILI|nr:hypothetical protein MUK42_20536 [Musa troglodytarum]
MHPKKNIAFSSVGDEQRSIWFRPVLSYSSTLDWVVALCDSLLRIVKSLISKLGLPLVSYTLKHIARSGNGGATMAIKHTATTTCRSVDGDMPVEEFQGVAEEAGRRQGRAHKPGRASTSHPLHPHGRFSGWKSARGIRYADADGDAFIDELEEFAHKCLGSKIVPD